MRQVATCGLRTGRSFMGRILNACQVRAPGTLASLSDALSYSSNGRMHILGCPIGVNRSPLLQEKSVHRKLIVAIQRIFVDSTLVLAEKQQHDFIAT